MKKLTDKQKSRLWEQRRNANFQASRRLEGVDILRVTLSAEDALARLEELVAGNPVGIGEIGLDNALEARNDSEQEEVFLAQMELAANYGRPVTVHCRKAFGRMVELVEAMKMRPPFMMLHAYAGSHEMVPVFEKLGFHISICASITRTANRKARTACVRVSPDRLLVESDSPAIAPVGVDFERNEPAYLPMVVQALAELRGEEPEAVAARTAANARLFFRCCAGVGTATK